MLPEQNPLSPNNQGFVPNQDVPTHPPSVSPITPPPPQFSPQAPGGEYSVPPPPHITQQNNGDLSSPRRKHVKLFIEVVLVIVFIGILAGGYFFYDSREHAYTEDEIISIARDRILPSIVQLRCFNADGEEASVGSGAYYLDNGIPSIGTNAHVVLASDGKYYGCNVYFPRASDGAFYSSAYKVGDVYLYHNVKSKINEYTEISGIDYAVLTITGPHTSEEGIAYTFPPIQESFDNVIKETCRSLNEPIKIGDRIYIIGYPDVGGESLTLTEGVVGGFGGENGEFIKISASTAHGNSGGITIGAKDGCYYGVPTQASFQTGGNLGYVLTGSFISDFLNGLTGEGTYSPDFTGEDFITYTNSQWGVSLDYPKSWKVTEEQGLITFTAPSESVFDEYIEDITLYIDNEAVSSINQYRIDFADDFIKGMTNIFPDITLTDGSYSFTYGDFDGHIAELLSYEQGRYFLQIAYIGSNRQYALTLSASIYDDSDITLAYRDILYLIDKSFQF